MSRIKITLDGASREYDFTDGVRLSELLRSLGYGISTPCGGHGLCGKCTVTLCTKDGTREVRACSALLCGDCEIRLQSDKADISWNAAAAQLPFEKGRHGLGAAADLGTTTVAVSLYALDSGKELGSLSRWNVQKSSGADVISRIGRCIDDPDGLTGLCGEIRGQLADMLSELCRERQVPLSEVKEMFLAGNTVMEHILAGVAPDSIASAPYLPKAYFDNGESVSLGDIPCYLSPCVSGYVGGDITAGLLASGAASSGEKFLFIDVGTNGEIVLGDGKDLVCCAVASGPAFEGAGINCGMPAADGAVFSAEISDGGLRYEVIGGGEARGICGSGLLDIVSCLLELGYIDESGYLESDDGDNRFYLNDTVYIDQRDIRRLQLAKAAVSAGISRLTEFSGTKLCDIDALYLAGGFGTRLRASSAVRIGMLPQELEGRIIPLGNTSLRGAALALLNPAMRKELNKIKVRCRYLELSTDAGFNDCFVDAMSFPED